MNTSRAAVVLPLGVCGSTLGDLMQPLDIHRPLVDHYHRFFGRSLTVCRPVIAEPWKLPETFQIGRFDPAADPDEASSGTPDDAAEEELDDEAQQAAEEEARSGEPRRRALHVYVTLGLAEAEVLPRIELFLLSPRADDRLAELLTAVALRHAAGEKHLGVGHSVDFHRPWLNESLCTRGLVSLPYLFGPSMEAGPHDAAGHSRSIYWLLPITPEEDQFKRTSGLEALEELFAAGQISTADPDRPSVV
jgi:hypothetical protein